MSVSHPLLCAKKVYTFAAALLLIAGGLVYIVGHSQAVQLGQRSMRLGDSRLGVTTNYELSFTTMAPSTIGSIAVQFCAEGPVPDTPCTGPVGFDVSSAVLSGESGITGFSPHSSSTASRLVLSRAPSLSAPATAQYTLSGVVNPAAAGSFYARIETFASSDGTGPRVDFGGIAMATTTDVHVRTYVPPYMLFCAASTIPAYRCEGASGTSVDFGELSVSGPKTGTSQLLLSTNGEGGYTIRVLGTTLTSGNNVISALTSPDVSRPGRSQFGFNLRANGTPRVGADIQGPGAGSAAPGYERADYYKYTPGEVIAASLREDDYRLYTLSYVVNIAPSQPPGVYVSTLTFVAVATF